VTTAYYPPCSYSNAAIIFRSRAWLEKASQGPRRDHHYLTIYRNQRHLHLRRILHLHLHLRLRLVLRQAMPNLKIEDLILDPTSNIQPRFSFSRSRGLVLGGKAFGGRKSISDPNQ
jgi:hypothetical protein